MTMSTRFAGSPLSRMRVTGSADTTLAIQSNTRGRWLIAPKRAAWRRSGACRPPSRKIDRSERFQQECRSIPARMVDTEFSDGRIIRKRDEKFCRRVVQYLAAQFAAGPWGFGSKNTGVRNELCVYALALRI